MQARRRRSNSNNKCHHNFSLDKERPIETPAKRQTPQQTGICRSEYILRMVVVILTRVAALRRLAVLFPIMLVTHLRKRSRIRPLSTPLFRSMAPNPASLLKVKSIAFKVTTVSNPYKLNLQRKIEQILSARTASIIQPIFSKVIIKFNQSKTS